MVALISVLAILLLSLLVIRVATVALSLTGVSREWARFQARSARPRSDLRAGRARGRPGNAVGALAQRLGGPAALMLVLYSTEDRLEELDARKRGAGGDEAHRRAARRRGKRSRFPRALAG